jgi:SAM-dependent methyltransferase
VGITVVHYRLKYLDQLPRDHGAAKSPDQFFAFAGKHGTTDHFYPTGVASDDIHSPHLNIAGMMVHRKRVIGREMLDEAPDRAAQANLCDLRRIHRWLGGHWIARRLLRRYFRPEESFLALDVGAASSGMAESVGQWFPRAEIVSLDRIRRNLFAAPSPKLVADAFRLPFARHSFDLVTCSLLLHHFPEEAIVSLLEEMRRVSRRAVIAIDLERHWLASRFIPWTQPIFGWSGVTVIDGPMSVRAAFTAPELESLARQAGLSPVRVERHFPWFRLSLTAAGGHDAIFALNEEEEGSDPSGRGRRSFDPALLCAGAGFRLGAAWPESELSLFQRSTKRQGACRADPQEG